MLLIDTMIGMIAAILTTSSFIPQIFKAYKRKRLDDLSPYLMLLFIAGASMWLIYGLFKVDAIIVVANVLALAFNLTLLLMKVMYANGKMARENK
ncbi:MAG: SemiSWEET transporter [Candidatus Nitrosocaldus sp.]